PLGLELGRVVAPVVAIAGIAIEVVGLGVGDDGEVVVALLERLGEPLRPLQLGNGELDADLAELVGDDLAGALGVAPRRQFQAGLEAVGIARLGKQRLGLGEVEGIGLGEVDIGLVVRREVAADRHAEARFGRDDLLAVDGVGDRLAHLGIVERLLAIVGRQDDLALGRADDDDEAR